LTSGSLFCLLVHPIERCPNRVAAKQSHNVEKHLLIRIESVIDARRLKNGMRCDTNRNQSNYQNDHVALFANNAQPSILRGAPITDVEESAPIKKESDFFVLMDVPVLQLRLIATKYFSLTLQRRLLAFP